MALMAADTAQPYIFGWKHLCFRLCANDIPIQEVVIANYSFIAMVI